MSGIETINLWGDAWHAWMTTKLLDATVVLVTVMICWTAMKRWVSPSLGFWLFLLVSVKVLVPFAFPAPQSFLDWIPRNVIGGAPDEEGAETPTTSADGPDSDAKTDSLTTASWMMFGWAGMTTLLLARFVLKRRRVGRLVDGATPLDPNRPPLDFDELRARMDVEQKVPLLESTEVAAPVLWGLRRQKLVLPTRMLDEMPADQLEWVLLHELAHVRRRDPAIEMFQRLIMITHFYCPAVWLARFALHKLRERTCDDLALVAMKEGHEASGAALQQVVEHAMQAEVRPGSQVGVFHFRTSLKTRTKRLLDPERTIRTRIGPGSICILIFMVLITLPRLEPMEEEPASSDRSTSRTEDH